MQIDVILGFVFSYEFDLLQYIDKRNTDQVANKLYLLVFKRLFKT